MDSTLLSQVITYVLFAWLGYVRASAMSLPARVVDWLLWLIAFIIAGSIQARIVDIFGFAIYSQHILQGLVIGILINFIMRLVRPGSSQPKPALKTK
jgi:hypothetical protein